jgi:8-oxo-dGTP pyrophosphatase MutT (NUDIX family)
MAQNVTQMKWHTADELRATLERFAVHGLPAHGRKHAAVAVAVTEAGFGAGVEGLPRHDSWSTEPALLLTKRASDLRAHAGQWAMPGGRIDDGETPEQAALRELHEEVGLSLDADAVLGRLDDYATRSGYVITPVVVWAGPARNVVPNAAEVASIHRIPVSELLRADAPLLNHVRAPNTRCCACRSANAGSRHRRPRSCTSSANGARSAATRASRTSTSRPSPGSSASRAPLGRRAVRARSGSRTIAACMPR